MSDERKRKISTTVYINPDQAERLRALHKATRVPIAGYIREGIDLILDKLEKQYPPPKEELKPDAEGGHDRGGGDSDGHPAKRDVPSGSG